MSIFSGAYLKMSKGRFAKEFKPLGHKKRGNHLVSAPDDDTDFIKALPFLEGLKHTGKVVLLASQQLESICRFLKPRTFEIVYYEKPATVLSKEHSRLKSQLGTHRFHTIIELNQPANLSLPYLVQAETRICFYDDGNFPYYNIMIKDDIGTLHEFFGIEETHPAKLFRFSTREYNKLLKKLHIQKPILLVNTNQDVPWDGDKIIVGHTVAPSSPELYEVLYFCDAYYGNQDALFEFAKLFEKRVLAA